EHFAVEDIVYFRLPMAFWRRTTCPGMIRSIYLSRIDQFSGSTSLMAFLLESRDSGAILWRRIRNAFDRLYVSFHRSRGVLNSSFPLSRFPPLVPRRRRCNPYPQPMSTEPSF